MSGSPIHRDPTNEHNLHEFVVFWKTSSRNFGLQSLELCTTVCRSARARERERVKKRVSSKIISVNI